LKEAKSIAHPGCHTAQSPVLPMNPKSIPTVAALVCGIGLNFSAFAEPRPQKPAATGTKDVSAAQVNGTWRCGKNTFKILALGNGKLHVDFDGVFEYQSKFGPSANVGQGSGVAGIEGDTAIFRPEGADADSKITLQFTGGKLIAKQEGTCGFGHRVYADGTYRKVSSRKPEFGK
jgi:hypothetical protein